MRSIRTKVTALTVIAIIISVSAVGLVSMKYIGNVANVYLREMLMLQCDNIEENLDAYFSSAEQGTDYDIDAIKNIITYDGHFRDGYTFLTGDDDRIIYHPDIRSGTPVSEISDDLAGGNLPETQTVLKITYEGVRHSVTWSTLSNGMTLYLAVPDRSITAYWSKFAKDFVAITILILAFFTALSAVISKSFVKPLTELAEAAGRIDAGDYEVDLEYRGDDEIGKLTSSFRQLTDHLKVYINDLNDMAYKDALTSVRNKGAFDMYIRKLDDFLSASDKGIRTEFAACVFDCNDLKGINDRYGHDKGDEFLKNACALICEVFNHSPVFRVGGDEFVCVLQGEDYNNREDLCREFESKADARNRTRSEAWDRINIACGVAVYDPSVDRKVQDVLNRADKRMYEDKQRKKANEK